jgi:Uncharacterized conserved protein (COG2071)
MPLPVIRATIDRRILVNYRIAPEILASVVPAPFRPIIVGGSGVAGICLIRLKHVRPRFFPSFFGTASENAAHRIAVEWDENGFTREGVYVPRRDTSSRLNAFLGGRMFPGPQHFADFHIDEHRGRYCVQMESNDGQSLAVEAKRIANWSGSGLFQSLDEASAFFRRGAIGYSPSAHAGKAGQPRDFDGLELRTTDWRIEPLAIESVASRFFEDEHVFPKGSVALDSALLMRGIEHEWHARPSIRGTTSRSTACYMAAGCT